MTCECIATGNHICRCARAIARRLGISASRGHRRHHTLRTEERHVEKAIAQVHPHGGASGANADREKIYPLHRVMNIFDALSEFAVADLLSPVHDAASRLPLLRDHIPLSSERTAGSP